MTLSDLAIKRPVFTIVMQLVLIVLGLVSIKDMGTDLFPDVSFPFVMVSTVYPGAAPGEVESEVTKPIEDAVAGIAGLDTVRSSSRESFSMVFVIFKMSTNVDQAAQDVRDRISAIRSKLPSDAKDPTIRRVDVGATPVLMYVASQDGATNQDVKKLVEDKLKPLLERVPGVAAVEVAGGADREVKVEVDRKRLDALNLPLTQIVDKLKLDNLAVPAGHYAQDKQEISVRLSGDFQTADDVGQVVVATTPSGTQIRLNEVAEVYDGLAEARTDIRSNGKPAVAFEVIKQSGTNTVQVADAVKKKIDEVLPMVSKDLRLGTIFDQSTFIRESTHEVEISIVYGGIMAVLVILFFMLDLRSTFISALALPTSVIGTFWIMSMLGFTLNMMTLLALSLAIGLLIDDAVVVRENIFRHLEMGEEPAVAASKGTSEIALAVLATTLAIVAVFVPVAFMQGVVGQFFRSFGLTISAATMLSLFVAFTLDPMLSSKLAVKIDHHKQKNIVVRFFEGIHSAMEEAYMATLRLSVKHRVITVLIGIAAFAGSLQLAKLMGNDFVPQEDRGQFIIDVELPPGTSLDETRRRLLPAELDMKKIPGIVTVYSKLGPNTEINKAQIRIVAVQKTERKETVWQIQDECRKVLEKVEGAKISIVPPAFVEGLPSGAPLQVLVRGTDLALLERDAAAVESMLKAIPGVADINVTYAPGKPEQSVRIDRKKASDMGIPVALVARTLRAALEGEETGKLRVESGTSKEVKIRVRLRQNDRSSLEQLVRLQIPIPPKTIMTPQGPMQIGGFIPLGDIARIEPESSPQVIERQDRARQIAVTAVPKGRSLGEVVGELEAKLATYKMQEGNYYRLDGMVKQMKESGESFGIAGLLAVVFIFLILASQFESFMHPLTIMMSLPLAMIGAWMGLFLTDNSMSMGSNIGVILLMGLVTKNGILLVDAALQLQREGMETVAAIVEAGRKRLRPILMTSAAMILGMLPTAIDQGPGSEFRSPMAIVVIGGVITSTLLTLLVLPSVFLWSDFVRSLPGRLFKKKPKPPASGSGHEAPAPQLEVVLLLSVGLLAWPQA
ncbi:MAG: efflux RND transporter permease subunit, partial [Deltaproteobacteria bacterium]|nr:efflux RND transporter permease subunit [Deltaproteobacteria bacterium]